MSDFFKIVTPDHNAEFWNLIADDAERDFNLRAEMEKINKEEAKLKKRFVRELRAAKSARM